MKWRSEESKQAHYSASEDEWQNAVLVAADALGDHLEAGKSYPEFTVIGLEPDQLGWMLLIVMSEWDGGDLWTLLSGVERAFVSYYAVAQTKLLAEIAANQDHKGEADEPVSLDK